MKVSDYIVEFLAEHGIKIIYGYIGGMITHLVDSIYKNDNVVYIQTYHEQTAGMAAEGYAIGSGNFGVAVCTSGPGVTNMITAIADAYFDSVPVLFISGQVNTTDYKYEKKVRQQGFQEMNVVDLVGSITKYAVLIDNPDNIRYELSKAIYIATHGRKGPVVVDLPLNISRADVDVLSLRTFEVISDYMAIPDLSVVKQKILQSQRPLILLGGGAKSAKKKIDNIAESLHIPIVTSLKGKGSIDESNELYVGMIGSYGNRCANMVVDKCDLLITLGARLDTRQTGARYEDFLKGVELIHVDLDDVELQDCRVNNRIKIHASVEEVLSILPPIAFDCQRWSGWLNWVKRIKSKYNQKEEVRRFVRNKSPYLFMQYLSERAGVDDVFVADVGQNEMWAAQTIELKRDRNFICSGGLAPMGFALPVAIGIAMSQPQRKVIAIVGDGGLQMSMQALLTIKQYKLNILIVVMNNRSLGMITQFQHLYFNDNMIGTTETGGYLTMDFEKLASANNIPYLQLSEKNLEETDISHLKLPMMVEYQINGLTTVSPKLEYNGAYSQPSPQLSNDEYEASMNS